MGIDLFKSKRPSVSSFALALAHDEVLRLRERQIARTASIRTRGTAILSASGVAASLVGGLSDNPWYAVSIAFFVLAAVKAVNAMTIRTTDVMHPTGVLGRLRKLDDMHARAEIIGQIRTEYDRAEQNLGLIAKHTQLATVWFLCGTVTLLMVSALPPIAALLGRG